MALAWRAYRRRGGRPWKPRPPASRLPLSPPPHPHSSLPTAQLVAATVPALNAARLALVGSGLVSDPGLVKSTSRSGERSELLRGPFYYCLVIIASTLLFWRDSPAGLIAVAMMAGGDGLADIVGRRWGKGNPLPWNAGKSWAGCAGMMAGGAAMAMG
jgi:phytol kinase